MRFPGFVGPSYKLPSVNIDCQRCINLYPEVDETGRAKEAEIASLVSTPGLRFLLNLGVNANRGMYWASKNRLFVVNGDKLYEIDQDWVQTERGTLNSSTGIVSMADNGIHLVIVDGDDGYVLVLDSNSFAEITDPDFPGANQVTFQDGYFIFNKPNSGSFFFSDLNDVTFDALDIVTSEGNPDNIIGIISDHRDLWIFNEFTTEVFFNSGSEQVFERIQGAFIEHGLAARFSIAKINNSVFWVGKDDKGYGTVYKAQGYQPQRISTHAVESAIQEYGDLSDAVAFSYQQNGHFFYVLNFPSANTTWVYDTTTNQWHERVFTNQGEFERHRAQFHVFAFNKHVVADYANGKIYELSMDVFSDDGAEITRQRIAPHLSSGMKRVFYSSFQLDLETGVGLDGVGQGTDPKAMLQFSDDGGHTWSNEIWSTLGKIGQTKARAVWRRLGSARDRVFKVSITDPVKVAIVGAEFDAQPGVN